MRAAASFRRSKAATRSSALGRSAAAHVRELIDGLSGSRRMQTPRISRVRARCCRAIAIGGAAATHGRRRAGAAPRRYARTQLVDMHGAPIRQAALAAETNYVFQYPFAATPCFLLRLARAGERRRRAAARGRRAVRVARRRRAGARRSSRSRRSARTSSRTRRATCSFIRYQPRRSATSRARVIHCCADHSVYDPARGRAGRGRPGAAAARARSLLDYDADARRARTRSARSAPSSSTRSSRNTRFKLATGVRQRRPARRADRRYERRARADAATAADDRVLTCRRRADVFGDVRRESGLPASDIAIVVRDLAQVDTRRSRRCGASRFAVRAGTTTALLGGNGAGKTTTLSMLLGVLPPTAGSISVLGCDMLRERHRVLPRMNFTSPYVDLPKRLTVRENLRVFADLYGVAPTRAHASTSVAAEFDLGPLLKRPYGEPVGGPAHARVACQGAAQRSRSAAARRAHRIARPGHRRPDAQLPRGATSATAAARCCSRRTTWARSSGCATT